jgi:hypothetical protein
VKETVQGAGLCEHSPIVLDLDGDGIEAGDPREGVAFDLRQTGTPVLSAWPRGDDAFLAMDLDGDGRISHGGELFGATRRHRDGFAALAELDRVDRGGNGDGVLDAADAGFARLVLWSDADRDGESDPDEIVPLAVEGIARLPLAHVRSTDLDRDGNSLREQGRFLRRDGRAGAMVDVWLRIRAVPEGPRRMWF